MKKFYSTFLMLFSVPLFGSVIAVGEKDGWKLEESVAYESMPTLRTPLINDGESVSIDFEVTASRIDLKIKTSSEENCDKLTICVDPDSENECSAEFSGEYDWREFSYEWGDESTHIIRLTYSKDVSVSGGEDCCWIWFEGIEGAFNGGAEIQKRWEFSDEK